MCKDINKLDKNFLLNKYFIRFSSNKGFALTQIFLLGIGLSISLLSLLNVSINRLSTSKISNKEMQAKYAAESALNNVRTLFNNSKSGAFYYYWLLKSCSFKVPSNKIDNECPDFAGGRYGNQWPGELRESYGKFRDPSKTFWSDTNDEWCAGNRGPNCEGRPIAPSCETLGRGRPMPKDIKWSVLTNNINHLLSGSEKTIESTSLNSNIQKFYIKSTDYMGDETANATNLLTFEGLNYSSKNRLKVNAANKIRAGVKISRNVTESGFGFLSVGENYNDDKSLFLGDFQIKESDQKGSIIWRKHINPNRDYLECTQIRSQSGIKNVNNLPDSRRQNGGLWVQPLLLPGIPKYDKPKGSPGGDWQPGNVVCLRTIMKNNNRPLITNTKSCTFLERTGFTSYTNEDRTFLVDNLVVRGKDAYFGVVTSDKSKVYLQVNGSVDVSNGGKICHIDESKRNSGSKDRCGSGNPENLIIVFNQGPNKAGKQRLSCSTNGGINYTKSTQRQPLHIDHIPHNTFNIASTGNKEESFSAFVYAPDTTFSTATPKTEYYSRAGNGWPLITTSKGVYAYMQKPSSSRNVERLPILIRNIYGDLIPYTDQPDKKSWNRRFHGLGDTYIIAAGRRGDVPSRPDIDILMRDMALVWDSMTKKYYLIGLLDFRNNVSNTQEKILVNRDMKDQLSNRTLKWKKDLGTDPFKLDASAKDKIIHHYGMELRLVSDLPKDKNFKGSSWVKNACFDQSGKTTWDFDSEYPQRLEEKLGSQYYFGVPYYRGKFIDSWDTLRSNE